MAKIRTMVVDDSGVFRGFWGRLLEKESNIEVVTTAVNGKAAIAALRSHEIDLVLLDIEMPEMNGLEAIPEIFKIKPNIKIIMASGVTDRASKITIDALALGAHEFIQKPSSLGDGKGVEDTRKELVEKVNALFGELQPSSVIVQKAVRQSSNLVPNVNSSAIWKKSFYRPKALVVGASTGGPAALKDFFSSFEKALNIPVLVVQHMPPKFTTMLAERFNDELDFSCVEAEAGMSPQAGTIYIAPGGFHMKLIQMGDSIKIDLSLGEPVNFCRPAVDVLFESAAKIYGAFSPAVILTGMGHDGQLGCKALKELGAPIFIQDEATSVVWGMPGAVARAGLDDFCLPIPEIVKKVEKLCP